MLEDERGHLEFNSAATKGGSTSVSKNGSGPSVLSLFKVVRSLSALVIVRVLLLNRHYLKLTLGVACVLLAMAQENDSPRAKENRAVLQAIETAGSKEILSVLLDRLNSINYRGATGRRRAAVLDGEQHAEVQPDQLRLTSILDKIPCRVNPSSSPSRPKLI
jgi:hypothetical protein